MIIGIYVNPGNHAFKEAVNSIPNKEIAQEFVRAVKVGGWGNLAKALIRSEELLKSTCIVDRIKVEPICAGSDQAE